jgi:hypothetical protein
MLSSKCTPRLLAVHIITVFELPPRLSLNTYVNFESLNGTNPPSPKAVITLPRVVRLLFIYFASSNTFPVAPVFPILSDPAKSTKFSLAPFRDPSLLI